MVAIPLRAQLPFVLVTMSIFWCSAVAGLLIVHSTSATEPASAAPRPAPNQAKAIHVVAVRSAARVETASALASTTFDDRWSAHDVEARNADYDQGCQGASRRGRDKAARAGAPARATGSRLRSARSTLFLHRHSQVLAMSTVIARCDELQVVCFLTRPTIKSRMTAPITE
jgi:hypothetical protein